MGDDRDYLLNIIEHQVKDAKGLVDNENPDFIVTAIVEAAGSDNEENKWEIPLNLPTFDGASGSFTITRFRFYERLTQRARAHIWAYLSKPDGQLVKTHEPVYVTHYLSNSELLGMSLGRRSDLKELTNGKQVKIPFED